MKRHRPHAAKKFFLSVSWSESKGFEGSLDPPLNRELINNFFFFNSVSSAPVYIYIPLNPLHPTLQAIHILKQTHLQLCFSFSHGESSWLCKHFSRSSDDSHLHFARFERSQSKLSAV